MKRIVLLIFVPIVLASAFGAFARPGGDDENIQSLIGVDIGVRAGQEFAQHIQRLGQIKLRSKSDVHFVGQLFQRTHRKFLTTFNTSATLAQTVHSGIYNCLTATAIYAMLLEHFEFNYKVIETNYHIFLIVETSKGDVLLETTDGRNGCVTGKENISRQIESYKNGSVVTASQHKIYFTYTQPIYNELTISNLEGLLHFNLAVQAYNQGELKISVEELERSYQTYSSERSEDFSSILLLTLRERFNQIPDRNQLIGRIVSLRNSKFSATATARAN